MTSQSLRPSLTRTYQPSASRTNTCVLLEQHQADDRIHTEVSECVLNSLEGQLALLGIGLEPANLIFGADHRAHPGWYTPLGRTLHISQGVFRRSVANALLVVKL